MVITKIKISVILVEKPLATLMVMFVELQSSYLLYNFHSNVLLLGDVILGDNENL